MKRRAVILSSIVTGLAAVFTVYQNFSRVGVEPPDLPSLARNSPLRVNEAKILVTAQNIPPLKLFVIVNPTAATQAHAAKLTRAFGQLFAPDEASSLAPFDVTTFVIGTAPAAPTEGLRHRAGGADQAALTMEFQKQVAALPSDASAGGGLCATARILRDPAALIHPGERAAFVIFSDEDDPDPAGRSCVRARERVTPADALINGRCEERSSILRYQTPTSATDTCELTSRGGYRFKYTYSAPVPVTRITYRKELSPPNYASPTTTLTYFTKGPAGSDTFFRQSPVVDGAVATERACRVLARKFAGVVTNDPAHPITCAPAPPKTGEGACPAELRRSGCTIATPAKYAEKTRVTVEGKFSGREACRAKARELAGGVGVDARHPAVCVATREVRVQAPVGTLPFTAAGDAGQTPIGACGILKEKIVALLPGVPGDGDCELTGYDERTTTVPAATTDCTAEAAKICDDEGGQTACVAAFKPGATAPKLTALPPVTQEMACTDLCAKADDLWCAPSSGVAIDPASTTVAQYLTARYGSGATCSVMVTPRTVSTFVDRKLADAGTLCAGAPGRPQYLVKDNGGATHHADREIPDFVAGTKAASDEYAPSTDLIAYVAGASHALLGADKLNLLNLIRTNADGGTAGQHYERWTQAAGGRSESITAPEYAASFAAFARTVRSDLERSFVLADLKTSQTIKDVRLRRGQTKDSLPLAPNQWTTAGNVVTIDPSVPLSPEDELLIWSY